MPKHGIAGAGLYLREIADLFETNYPAKVTEINARGDSYLSGELKTVQLFSKSKRRSIDAYPALFVMPDEGAAPPETIDMAYRFEITVVDKGTDEEELVQVMCEHELAVTEIVIEHPSLDGLCISATIVAADYSDLLYEAGDWLVLQVRLAMDIYLVEPKRHLAAHEGGAL